MDKNRQLTFKTRDGKEKTVELTHDQCIFGARCPVDGTLLVQTIGEEDYYIDCQNCGRNYYSGEYPDICTQQKVDEKYRKETEDTRAKLLKLRGEFQQEESRLCKTIQELENPFTQEQTAPSQ